MACHDMLWSRTRCSLICRSVVGTTSSDPISRAACRRKVSPAACLAPAPPSSLHTTTPPQHVERRAARTDDDRAAACAHRRSCRERPDDAARKAGDVSTTTLTHTHTHTHERVTDGRAARARWRPRADDDAAQRDQRRHQEAARGSNGDARAAGARSIERWRAWRIGISPRNHHRFTARAAGALEPHRRALTRRRRRCA